MEAREQRGCIRWFSNKRKKKNIKLAIMRLDEVIKSFDSKVNEYQRRAEKEEQKAKVILKSSLNRTGISKEASRTRAKNHLRLSRRALMSMKTACAAQGRLSEIRSSLDQGDLNVHLHDMMKQGSSAIDELLKGVSLDKIEDLNDKLIEQASIMFDVTDALTEPIENDILDIERELAEFEDGLDHDNNAPLIELDALVNIRPPPIIINVKKSQSIPKPVAIAS